MHVDRRHRAHLLLFQLTACSWQRSCALPHPSLTLFPFLSGENRVPGAAVRSREPAQLRALRSPGACAGPGEPVLGDLRGAEPLDRGNAGPDLAAAPSSHRPRAAQAAAGGHEGKAVAEWAIFLIFIFIFSLFFSFWGSYLCNTRVPWSCHLGIAR